MKYFLLALAVVSFSHVVNASAQSLDPTQVIGNDIADGLKDRNANEDRTMKDVMKYNIEISKRLPGTSKGRSILNPHFDPSCKGCNLDELAKLNLVQIFKVSFESLEQKPATSMKDVTDAVIASVQSVIDPSASATDTQRFCALATHCEVFSVFLYQGICQKN